MPTNPFQQLCASLVGAAKGPRFEITEPAYVVDPTTGSVREVDIVIRDRITGLRTLVECRDHARAQDEMWIDQLVGKKTRLGYARIVAVSSSGFTPNALAGAQAHGIEALRLTEAEDRDWGGWLLDLRTMDVEVTVMPGRVPTSIGITVASGYLDHIREDLDFTKVLLHDPRFSSSVPLLGFIRALVDHPKTQEELTRRLQTSCLHHERHFEFDPTTQSMTIADGTEPIPIVRVTVNWDAQVRRETSPVTLYDLNGKRFLALETTVFGEPRRLVMHKDGDDVLLYTGPTTKNKPGKGGDRRTPGKRKAARRV